MTGKPAKRSRSVFKVLKREHGGRREKGGLLVVHDGLEGGTHRDLGLAVADIAAEQAVHRRGRLHVLLDVGDGADLIGRRLVREGALELLLPVGVWREGMSRHGLALGVQLQELLGHVAHGLFDAGLRFFPGRAAKAVERGTRAAGVFLDEVQPFDRNEELVFAGVAQLEKLLRRLTRAGHAELLEADELPDAMVDMDDEIAHLEVAKIREKRSGETVPLVARAAFLFEDVRLGVHLKARLQETESARKRADGHQHCRGARIFNPLDRHRDDFVLPQNLHDPFRAATAVGDKEDRVASLARLANLGDPFVDTAPELPRGLAGHMATIPVLAHRQLLEARRHTRASLELFPRHERLGG